VSTGAIVGFVVVGLLVTLFVPLRIAVAKQRRAVETARARLAAARTVRRRAEGVPVEAIQKIGRSIGRVSRPSTCALTDDGFYCLSEDGRWGARVRLAPGALDIGDVALVGAPGMVKDGTTVGPLADDLLPLLDSLPKDGLVLQLGNGLTWFAAVPEAAEWYAALQSRLGDAGAATRSA
jgi:hypothetical protein